MSGNTVVKRPELPRRGPTATHKHGDRSSYKGEGHLSFDEALHLTVGMVLDKDGRESLLLVGLCTHVCVLCQAFVSFVLVPL